MLSSSKAIIMSYIGSAIRVLRVGQFKKQSDLSDFMSKRLSITIGQSYVSNVESGKIQISHDRLKVVCEFFNITVERIAEIAERIRSLEQEKTQHQ